MAEPTGHRTGVPLDPWLRRNVHLAGAPPSFAESPLASVWARATDTRPSPDETLAGIREGLRREAGDDDGRRGMSRRRLSQRRAGVPVAPD